MKWMTGNYKKFEQDVFNKTDAPARDVGIKLFNSLFNMNTIENPDKYGIDLLILDPVNNQVMGGGEVEVKLVWDGPFRFKTLHFPERKAKFAQLGSAYFVVFNKDLTQCFMVDSLTLLNSPLVEIKNYKVKEGEMFYDVPLSKCLFFDLKNNLNVA